MRRPPSTELLGPVDDALNDSVEVGLVSRHLGNHLFAELDEGFLWPHPCKVDNILTVECLVAQLFSYWACQSGWATAHAINTLEVVAPHYFDCVLQTQNPLKWALKLLFHTRLHPLLMSCVFRTRIANNDFDGFLRVLLPQSFGKLSGQHTSCPLFQLVSFNVDLFAFRTDRT